jgi:hypothetical protein
MNNYLLESINDSLVQEAILTHAIIGGSGRIGRMARRAGPKTGTAFNIAKKKRFSGGDVSMIKPDIRPAAAARVEAGYRKLTPGRKRRFKANVMDRISAAKPSSEQLMRFMDRVPQSKI